MIKQDTARKVAQHTYVILDDNVAWCRTSASSLASARGLLTTPYER